MRRSRRRFEAGFTLLELLIVVLMVALIAMIAVPKMSVARTDKIAFNYARQVTQLYHKARTDAAGTGSAHLVAYTTQFGAEGVVFTFDAQDNTCIPGVAPPCPSNPSPSCTRVGTYAAAYTIGAADDPANGRFVEGLNIITLGPTDIRRADGIRMVGSLNGVNSPAIVMCVTPLGETYVGSGGNINAAVANMVPFGLPFGNDPGVVDPTTSGTARVEIVVQRNAGLRRRVIIAGGASPRIRSE